MQVFQNHKIFEKGDVQNAPRQGKVSTIIKARQLHVLSFKKYSKNYHESYLG